MLQPTEKQRRHAQIIAERTSTHPTTSNGRDFERGFWLGFWLVLRISVYVMLAALIGVALGACGDAGAGAVSGPKPDCARVITVPFHDATVVGTLTVTVFYPDSLKRNCGPASGG